MAYDSEPSERTVTRDRVLRLRDFLKALPPEKFDMRYWGEPECGTAGCIGGWTKRLFWRGRSDVGEVEIGALLGLTTNQSNRLFYPSAKMPNGLTGYNATTAQAVAVLDHYLDTGKIDWSVAK